MISNRHGLESEDVMRNCNECVDSRRSSHAHTTGCEVLALVLVFAALLFCASPRTQAADSFEAQADRVLAGSHRSDRNRARDVYRHPKETLAFFGLRADLHVAEIWPGAGWYTEILAPLLRDHGKYFAAHYHVDDNTHRFYRNSQQQFVEKLAKQPALYDRAVVTGLLPPQLEFAPKASLDMVLTFRNVHNWTEQGYDQEMFNAFFAALKSGGVLGVVEHRAKEGTSRGDMVRSGYMTEAYVIELAQKAGFKLAARSEVNANPKDTKDHPRGVWTLPPSLRLGDEDRAKYLAIGESDRMTLKFVKP
jgi:predicted methyltransferase